MSGSDDFLPYGRQVIDDEDIAAVTDVLRAPFLTTGPRVGEFEAAFAAYVEAPHAIVVSNGTAALHLAAMALDLGPGDQVIVPAITFVATANAARYVGADVIFADVDPDTGLMRVCDLEAAISKADISRLKAVFNVHLGGQCEDVAAIRALTDSQGLKLLDDACHGIGTSAGGKMIGSCAHADMSVFSFHPVKTIAMGEGGAITTRNPDVATRLRHLRSHGITHDTRDFENKGLALDREEPNPWYHELQELGLNYRATDIQCALGLSQLTKADRFVTQRRLLVDACDTAMSALAPSIKPVKRLDPQNTGWHLNVALFDFDALGMSRRSAMQKLRAQGIGSQVHYIPVPLQPYYHKLYGKPDLPGAMKYYERCLSLPLAADMTVGDMERVVKTLKTLQA
jgi:UDP-4-amino-4,6-dideoxy-N-acetyl-beta-L-altrosamine transaminase